MPNESASTNGQTTIVRTDRGLTIAGTRLTLYAIMDYLKAQWPHDLIRGWLGLTENQLAAALEYINEHHDQVEQEYQDMERQAASAREFWEAKQTAPSPSRSAQSKPVEQAELRARLQSWKDRLAKS